MKQIIKILAAVLIAVITGAAAISALLFYCTPMENRSYDLSMFAEDGEDYAQDKGWTVFINEQGKKKKLTADGFGGFFGLDYAGQTIYFSRELVEELDSPAISIDAANRAVSVFLDDTLLYTDCPDADNRIGYVNLPMFEYDREEDVTVTLPQDCHGKILTIAQSTPVISEKQEAGADMTVYPSEAVLYCGYSYESGLIADASKTAIPAAVLFTLGVVLLAVFVWDAAHGSFSAVLPVIALAVFLEMCSLLTNAPFFYKYIQDSFRIDLSMLFSHLSISALLLYLALRAVRSRWILIAAVVLQLASIPLSVLVQYGLWEDSQIYINLVCLPGIVSLPALLAALAYSFYMADKGSIFHKYMSRTALGLILCYAGFVLLSVPFVPDYAVSVAERVMREISILLPKYTLNLLWSICLASSITALAAELLKKEIERRSAVMLLAVKNELAMESYKNLKHQNMEIQEIRHDTAKHYAVLRTMLDKAPERMQEYLDDLIGQLHQVRPVVESGNDVLDILINGKLSAASDAGIQLDIVHAKAPKNLPLSDAELCSLIVNILDNAVNAASSPGITDPYIRLDMQCKNNYFVFSCENSMQPDKNRKGHGHGYGLKIVDQIMKKYGEMVSVESTGNHFKITVAVGIS